MSEVKFFRGLKSDYDKEYHKDGLYFATDKREIILNGESYGLELDDELLSNSTNPATGRSIYKAIQDAITNAIETTPIGNSLMLVKQGNTYKVELYDKRTDTLLSQTTGFIGGEGIEDLSGLDVTPMHGMAIYSRSGQEALIKFRYDVLNSNGYSTGTPGKVTFQIINTANGNLIATFEKDLVAGEISTTDVTEYLIEGSSITVSYKVVAITDKGEQTETYSCKVYSIDIVLLDEGFNIAVATKVGDSIKIPYKFEGSNVAKTVTCYLNGEKVAEETKYDAGSFDISTAGLSHGSHSVQIRAEYRVDDVTPIYSNSIYYSLVVYEEGNTKPLVATRFEYSDGSLVTGIPAINIEQYDSYELPYAVYDPSNVTAEIKFYSGEDLISVNNSLFAKDVFSYRYTSHGSIPCSIRCGSTKFDYYVNVAQSSLAIEEPTDSLVLYLDAYGKSNNSDSRNTWTYKSITSDFENVNFGGDGWIDNGLRLLNGGKVTVNYQPLISRPESSENAFAFTIRFKVTNVVKDDEVVVSCIDEDGTGFVITTQEAKFVTNGGKTVSTKFASDEVYTIGFVSYPVASSTSGSDTKTNTSMIYLYVNGILSGAEQRDSADSIYQAFPKNITLKADNCTLDVYSMRAYNTHLTDEQIFSCYLIDLGDSKTFHEEYEQNDILDFNRNISVNSIYGKIPYVIVTGKQEDGQATLPYVAVVNDKDPKYDVDSILYVDGAHPEFNFMCIPGSSNPQIRLQGTSSMAYPRKNYRIYTKKARLFLGCDAEGVGGVELESPDYAMSETAAPVNCFCLKADFAESSSSHNTGMANMVQDVLTKTGDLTPAQKYVNKDVYPYEVRTTIEGHPCLLFYRANPSDTPIFAGKFNFNNDKSTEAVFGFLDINGYHDNPEFSDSMSTLATDSLIFPDDFTSVTVKDGDEEETFDKEAILKILKNNPTECWEFKNNNNRMGVFKEADFEKKIVDEESGEEMYSWLQMWEARFPDEDGLNAAFEAGVKPKFLMRTAKWLHSTDTEEATGATLSSPVTYGTTQYTTDSAEYRAAKFKNELKDYFDVRFLCDYYIINDCVAGVDQRVKNMMWGFWYDPDYSGPGDGVLCYPIYYDNDTILGVRNDGKNIFNWDIDENSIDPTSNPDAPSYAFAGHDSVLWKNLREQFVDDLKASYVRLRANMGNLRMYYFFDDTQSGKFCEKIYNKDAIYKYIIPKTQGVEVNIDGVVSMKVYNYTTSSQGDRKAHRHWFIGNRMDLFDARYNTGTYPSSFIQIKGPNDVATSGNQVFKATAARNYYFNVRSDEGMTLRKPVEEGETWTYEYDKNMTEGSTFYFTGCKWMSKLDLSNWKGALNLDIPTMPALEEFILGNKTNSNYGLAASPITVSQESGTTNMPLVKRITINNYKSISSFNFSLCRYLRYLDLSGCDGTTIAQFAEGGSLSEVHFPKNYQRLILRSLPEISTSKLYFEDITKLRALRIENCARIDAKSYMDSILATSGNNLKYVRITGLDITDDGSDLIRYYEAGLGGINSSGADVADKCYLVGKYRLTSLLDDTTYKNLCDYFPELDLQQPKYTEIRFNIKNSTPEKLSNYDNKTGYDFSNTYVPSGHISKILEQRKSYLVTSISESASEYQGVGSFAAIQLDENDSTLYSGTETTCSLTGSEGDFCMYEPHYWYKGVNDYTNGRIYAFYSSQAEKPTEAQGTKFKYSDLTLSKKTAVQVSNSFTDITSAKAVTDSFHTYEYTLPENHNYVRARVAGVASPLYGCVVCDSTGKIISRHNAENSSGMFNGSYLWFNLPNYARTIYFTVSSDDSYKTSDLALYLTPSLDIEDLEPDWVEHKASFVGKVMSMPEDAESAAISKLPGDTSAVYSDALASMNIAQLSQKVTLRNTGFKLFDYEAYKEILLLGYLNYGTTNLHGEVGQGHFATGTTSTYNVVYRYYPNGLNYALYGNADTLAGTTTTDSYPSYYINKTDGSEAYPGISTLMGYHQFIGCSSTISNTDEINKTTNVLTLSTGRKVKLFMGSAYQYSSKIQGGRYLDLLGTSESKDENQGDEGFCSMERFESGYSSTSTKGYLTCGWQRVSVTNASTTACFRVLDNTSATPLISNRTLDRILRIMIVPNHIVFCNDVDTYKTFL